MGWFNRRVSSARKFLFRGRGRAQRRQAQQTNSSTKKLTDPRLSNDVGVSAACHDEATNEINQNEAAPSIDQIRLGVLKLFGADGVPQSQLFFFEDDRNVDRYLAARKGDVEKAAVMLHATLIWREENGLCGIGSVPPDFSHNCFLPIGLTSERHVILYSNHARTSEADTEKTFLHAFRVFESCISDDDRISRVVWVMDFNGFGYRHLSSRQVSIACDWFGNHFPERLSQIVLLNPPTIFKMVHGLATSMMDPDSAKKMLILRNDEDKSAYFQDHFSAETSDWLMETSNTEPVPGGGYAAGTDLELLPKTQWVGPPTQAIYDSLKGHGSGPKSPFHVPASPHEALPDRTQSTNPPSPPPAYAEPAGDECTPSLFFEGGWLFFLQSTPQVQRSDTSDDIPNEVGRASYTSV